MATNLVESKVTMLGIASLLASILGCEAVTAYEKIVKYAARSIKWDMEPGYAFKVLYEDEVYTNQLGSLQKALVLACLDVPEEVVLRAFGYRTHKWLASYHSATVAEDGSITFRDAGAVKYFAEDSTVLDKINAEIREFVANLNEIIRDLPSKYDEEQDEAKNNRVLMAVTS